MQTIQIVLDTRQCQGYGMCLMSEDIFEMSPGAQVANLKTHQTTVDRLGEIEELAKSCPAQAIRFSVTESV